jgi:predicted RNA-binding Zn ribbon-like protein
MVTWFKEKLMAESLNAQAMPLRIGDHPALDFLNTVARVNGRLVDSLTSDSDVLQWLERVGWGMESVAGNLHLLEAAHRLREVIRRLVEQGSAEESADASALSEFLTQGCSSLRLLSRPEGGRQLKRVWQQRTAGEVLAPLAESAAELIANGDFNLIRQCEDEDCVLWFYDRTKSHHRRWCSMAACGNRHKVAAYRKRQQVSS